MQGLIGFYWGLIYLFIFLEKISEIHPVGVILLAAFLGIWMTAAFWQKTDPNRVLKPYRVMLETFPGGFFPIMGLATGLGFGTSVELGISLLILSIVSILITR